MEWIEHKGRRTVILLETPVLFDLLQNPGAETCVVKIKKQTLLSGRGMNSASVL